MAEEVQPSTFVPSEQTNVVLQGMKKDLLKAIELLDEHKFSECKGLLEDVSACLNFKKLMKIEGKLLDMGKEGAGIHLGNLVILHDLIRLELEAKSVKE